jgi:hypothetical protein
LVIYLNRIFWVRQLFFVVFHNSKFSAGLFYWNSRVIWNSQVQIMDSCHIYEYPTTFNNTNLLHHWVMTPKGLFTSYCFEKLGIPNKSWIHDASTNTRKVK